MRRPLVRRVAQRALAALDVAEAELSIALVDDARMRALNRRYRRVDRTTDVLAFPQQDRGAGSGQRAAKRHVRSPLPVTRYPVLLGDVVMSVETAARRVGRAPAALHAELARYLVHGLLHLQGWDHHAPAARRQMRRQERRVWRIVWG